MDYFICILLLSFSTGHLTAQNDALLAKADSLAEVFEFKQAVRLYKQSALNDSSDCQLQIKIAEMYVNLGEESQDNRKQQYFYIAEKHAKRAVALCPENPEGHFFVAAAAGLLALHEGGKRKVERSREIKDAAETVLKLDPEHDGAHHILGQWNREAANLSWVLKAAAKVLYGGIPEGATNESAIRHFEKAVDIDPAWINHRLELGKTYMIVEQWQKAREQFETVLTLDEKDHQDDEFKAECRKLLEEIAGNK